MSGIWGNNLKVSIFGESHGNAIGINIDGLPSGIELDLDNIDKEMKRRALEKILYLLQEMKVIYQKF